MNAIKTMKDQYRGLTPYKAPDAPVDGAGMKTGLMLYPPNLADLHQLERATGIESRSQLIRAAIKFAAKNKAAFVETAGDC
jgi:hypothetical protein